jgi:hypothetical protein
MKKTIAAGGAAPPQPMIEEVEAAVRAVSGFADDLTIAMVQSVSEGRGAWCIDKRVYKVDSEQAVAAGLGGGVKPKKKKGDRKKKRRRDGEKEDL